RLRAAAPDSRAETVWVDDELPPGATPLGDGESWNWVRLHPAPLSGKAAHKAAFVAGLPQHHFQGAATTLSISVGDRLFAHVYLDPVHKPREVMLQWNDGSWEHRAYWGENLINFGTDGTVTRQFMGNLPPAGGGGRGGGGGGGRRWGWHCLPAVGRSGEVGTRRASFGAADGQRVHGAL